MMKKTLSKILLLSTVFIGAVGLGSCGMSKDDSSNNSTQEKTSDESSNNKTSESSTSKEETYYTVSFNVDAYVKVYVYDTKDMSLEGEETTLAYSKDGDSGSLLGDGTGQVNFKLEFVDGYELDDISISGTYSNLKGSSDTGYTNGYRITKIQSDLSVTIKSKSITEEEVTTESDYKATFTTEHCTIYVYDTQDTSGEGTLSTEAYARDSVTGNLLSDGTGQINFKVVCDEGYTVTAANIVINGTYNNLKAISEGIFRITKIQSDLTITIEAVLEESLGDTLTELTIESTYNSETLTLYVNSTSEFTYTYTDDLLTINTNYENTITLNGSYYGAIVINTYADLCVNLNSVTLRSDTVCPLYISSTGDVEISAKKGTTNYIYDDRAYVDSDSESVTDVKAAIYTQSDLSLKGTGVLNITSANNNGIHTKGDLESKNITLNINVCDNALKGNDSILIESGVYELISRQGDGIKTSNSSLNSNDVQQGSIIINGGSFNIYAACDGIDSAFDLTINDVDQLNIFTDKYSDYSEEVTSVSDSIYYIKSLYQTYTYSIYYYNSSTGDYLWKNSGTTYNSTVTQQQGPQTKTYYYYEVEKPASGYDSLIVYVYSSSQSQGQSSSYYKKSSNMSMNNNYDTLQFNSSSFSWTNYSTQQSGMGGFGGMNEGNSDKGDYSTKGLKAANSITIQAGTINIEAYDDAIHANNDSTIESGAKALGNVTINGGNITLSSNDDGIHADNVLTISGGVINITKAYEGIEGNQIYFNGGSTYVYATDDAINSAYCNSTTKPCVYINDGYIDLDVASGDTDTLDSNGDVKMTGGILVVKNRSSQSSSQTGGTIDLDGSFSMTGGLLISFGTWCTECNLTATKSSTSSVASGTYTVKDSSNNTILTTELATSYSGYRIISKLSGSYTLYKGSTSVTTF